MFIHNITIKVENKIVQEWLQWQKEVHIPGVMATNLFNENRLLRLLEHDSDDSSTYVLQYFTNAKENYDRYIKEHDQLFTEMALEKWGNNFISFRTLLETVH